MTGAGRVRREGVGIDGGKCDSTSRYDMMIFSFLLHFHIYLLFTRFADIFSFKRYVSKELIWDFAVLSPSTGSVFKHVKLFQIMWMAERERTNARFALIARYWSRYVLLFAGKRKKKSFMQKSLALREADAKSRCGVKWCFQMVFVFSRFRDLQSANWINLIPLIGVSPWRFCPARAPPWRK